MNLIYISNTRIPSEKANTYQSMVMCEAFSKYFDKVEFWYPKMNNKKLNNNDIHEFYGVDNNFILKEIFSIDSKLFYILNKKIWFILESISFAIVYILKLRKEDSEKIIFTRDSLGLKILSRFKKYGFIKQKIFFEAHTYSKNIKYLFDGFDGLIVINNYLKKLYEKDGIQNILVAHDGVKITEYSNMKKRSKNKISNLVYTGNLFQWKGVYTILDAMKYFNDDIKLIIVGGSSDTLPQFKKYIKNKKIKNVEVIGFVKKNDTLDYIEKADILILPNSAKDKMSYYTSPLKLFEYMASKRPIIASKLPSIEEILEHKNNAILFEPDDSKDFAEKIEWILGNDCNKIINNAYKKVQEYTWDKRTKSIKKWIDEFNSF